MGYSRPARAENYNHNHGHNHATKDAQTMASWGDPATAAMLTIDRICIHFSAFWPVKLRRRVCHAQPGAQVRSISWRFQSRSCDTRKAHPQRTRRRPCTAAVSMLRLLMDVTKGSWQLFRARVAAFMLLGVQAPACIHLELQDSTRIST